eukprot:6183946-Pleurochrysis_carterae.AAC.7
MTGRVGVSMYSRRLRSRGGAPRGDRQIQARHSMGMAAGRSMLLLTLCLPATAAWQLHTCHIMQTTQARCASHTAVPQRLASFQRTPVGHVVALATASQDELIATLRRTPESEMEPILANNIKAIDQLFFLRLAEMSDEANDELERDEIGRLAST